MESIGENKLLKLTCEKNAQVRMEGRWATSSILELVRTSNLCLLRRRTSLFVCSSMI